MAVDGYISLETEAAGAVELLIQGGGTDGSTTLVEAAGATVTPWAGSGADPWYYEDAPYSGTKWASTCLQNPLSGNMRYDVALASGLGASWTFDLWLAAYGTGTRYVFTNRGNNGTDRDIRLYRSSSTLYFSVDGTIRITASGLTNNLWKYVRLTYNGTYFELQVDDTSRGTYSDPGLAFDSTSTVSIFGYGTAGSNSSPMSGNAEDVRLTLGYVRTGNKPSAAMPYPEALGAETYYGPLGTPQAMAWSQYGALSLLGPLGVPELAAWHQYGAIVLASPLQSPAALGWHDYTGALTGREPAYYVMDLTVAGQPVRVPISSWQATLKVGSSGYVQCVVPNAGAWADQINAATSFSVSRLVTVKGQSFEQEMFSSGLDPVSDLAQINYARGATNWSCTIAAYPPAYPDLGASPPTAYDRTLQGIRSQFSGTSGSRVRCSVDLILRPGHRVFAGADEFVARYVNYYAPGNGDHYMDVGA